MDIQKIHTGLTVIPTAPASSSSYLYIIDYIIDVVQVHLSSSVLFFIPCEGMTKTHFLSISCKWTLLFKATHETTVTVSIFQSAIHHDNSCLFFVLFFDINGLVSFSDCFYEEVHLKCNLFMNIPSLNMKACEHFRPHRSVNIKAKKKKINKNKNKWKSKSF